MSKEERMEKLAEEIAFCRRCGLCDDRQNPVVGEGNLDAVLALIGEAPGRFEDATGRPFVGSAGKLLDRLLNHIGLMREDVYIGNVVKCRPPKNRRPKIMEIKSCCSYLERQLEIICPRVIAPMGNSSIQYYLRRFEFKSASIGKIHGKRFEVEAPWSQAVLFPLYHPAAALYNKDLIKVLEEDIESLGVLLDNIVVSRT